MLLLLLSLTELMAVAGIPPFPWWNPGCKNGSCFHPPAVCINQCRFNQQEPKVLTALGLQPKDFNQLLCRSPWWCEVWM